MVAGRPRTTTPPPKEVVKLGQEMVKWFKTEPVRKKYHLNQWWSLEKEMLKSEWDALCQKDEFLAYYERARHIVAQRYIDGSINPSIAQRFLRLYYPELKKDEDDKMKQRIAYEIELRQAAAQSLITPPNDEKIDEIIDNLKTLKNLQKKDK